jgi:Dehydratase family
LIGNLRFGGTYTAKDVYDIGGAAVVIRALVESGHIDGSCLTVTGRSIAEGYGGANVPDGEIVHATNAPNMPDGGVAVLKGNLCPDGAVIKVASLKTWCSKVLHACSRTRKPVSMRSATAECKLDDQTRDGADKEPREERSCGRSQTSLYNATRTYLSVNTDAPMPRTVHAVGRIVPKPFLGGLHHLYVRV